MGTVIENEKTKRKCQIFTPEEIVKSMADYLGYTDHLYGKKILENSCGDGSILREIVIRYIDDCQKHSLETNEIRKGLENDIYGIEIDTVLYNKCINNLNKIVLEHGIKHVKWSIYNRDALREPIDMKFDFIIGNPPYVSYWDLDISEREFIELNYSVCRYGAWDYSYAFLQDCISRLDTYGRLVFIIPNSIFKTKSGKAIRSLIRPIITKIYDYTTTKVFEQVLTSPAIIVIDKAIQSDEIEYHNISETSTIRISKNLFNDNWVFGNYSNCNIKKTSHRFGDYFKIATGVATQLNKVFVLQGWTEHKGYLQKGNYQVELSVVRKAASPKGKKQGVKEHIIFPYYYEEGLLIRYEESDFKRLFPKTYKYLSDFKNILERRDSDKNSKWFEYGRSQALAHINQPKLLLSTVITDDVLVYELEENEVPYSGLYITTLGRLSLETAKEILESEEFFKYIRPVGVNANGKSIRIVAKNICDFLW